MQSRETDVKRLLFQQRHGYVGVIDIRLVRATARDSRTHVIRTCEIFLIRFNYGGVVRTVYRFESHQRECERARWLVP